MQYKAKVNLLASGVKIQSGELYTGPADLVPRLLSAGLLVPLEHTTDVVDETSPTTDVVAEEKPKKKRAKKGT